MRTLNSLLLVASLAVSVQPATAETFPDRPVRVILPVPAGNNVDQAARIVTDFAAQKLGQSFIIVNRPGAGGEIGGRECAKSPPDGYTICMLFYSVLVAIPLDHLAHHDELPYGLDAFTPIARTSTVGFGLVARKDVGCSIAALEAYAKSRGNLKVAYGAGVNVRVAAYMLKSTIPATTPIPTGNAEQAALVQGLASHDLDAGFVNLVNARNVLQIDRDTCIVGVLGNQRSQFLPETPALSEAVPTFANIAGWSGLFAPAGTPDEKVAVFEKAALEALADPGVQDRLKKIWLEPYPATRAAFEEQIKEHRAAYRKTQ